METIKRLAHFRTTPNWNDTCNHPEGSYLFSFTDYTRGEAIDCYCFQGSMGQEFCLRYGNDGPNYYSPTGIRTIINSSECEPYKTFLSLLLLEGKVIWEPNANHKSNDNASPDGS